MITPAIERAIRDRVAVLTEQVSGLSTGGCPNCNFRTPQQLENFTLANQINLEINELEAFLNGGNN